MSDQVSFMDLGMPMNDEERLLQAITPCLITASQQYGITADALSSESLKNYTSVSILGNLALRIRCTKQLRYISCRKLPADQQGLLKPFEVTQTKADAKAGFIRINLSDFAVTPELEAVLNAIIVNCLASLSGAFDCCSRYEACSDAKRCVHPDPIVSVGCGYRKNLNQGRIFYGKNRNVD